MTAAPAAGGLRLPRPLRRLGFACTVAACVALPALAAGVRIDDPAAPGELERLRAAYEGSCGSRLTGWFELMTLPAVDSWPRDPAALAGLLAAARLAQVLGLLALAMLVYVAMLLARGRLAALAACVGLALLPATMVQGSVLRPETAAAVLTGLGLVLVQCLFTPARSAVPNAAGAAMRLALAASAAVAFGLAFAAAPGRVDPLLLAPVLAMLVAMRLLLRGLRVLRRRGLAGLPARAISGQLWPPTLTAFGTLVMALVCLDAAILPGRELPAPTGLVVGMWPEHPLGAGLLLTLCGLGAFSFLLRTGARFGRRGRAGADLVVLLYCLALGLRGLSQASGLDPLPSAPAVAILFGEGVLALVSFLAWSTRRRAGSVTV